jgi:DNA polymerase-1
MPEDLGAQIAPLYECIRALGWPLLEVEGVEADDVIGTLALEAEQQDIRTVISSGDKDLTQLVDAHVTMVNTMSNETFDEAGVVTKFGVKPERITDYLTLVGDSVDNIPGVDKVGPKTAAKWLAQYGTLDNLLAHADDITGAVGENLRKARDWLPQARRLVTVKRDVRLPLRVDQLTHAAYDKAKLAELFDRFEFRAWRRELGDVSVTGSAPAAPAAPHREYASILTEDGLAAWRARIENAELTAVATETTSPDPLTARLVGISFSVEPARRRICRWLTVTPERRSNCRWTRRWRVSSRGSRTRPDPRSGRTRSTNARAWQSRHSGAGVAHDTLLESYVLESHKPHDVDSLTQRHLGVKTYRLRRHHRQGRVPDRFRPGVDRTRYGVLGRERRPQPSIAQTVTSRYRQGRRTGVHL